MRVTNRIQGVVKKLVKNWVKKGKNWKKNQIGAEINQIWLFPTYEHKSGQLRRSRILFPNNFVFLHLLSCIRCCTRKYKLN